MVIIESDWAVVVEAFERGKRAEQRCLRRGDLMLTSVPTGEWLEELPVKEKVMRAELKKLLTHLQAFSPDVLAMIDIDIDHVTEWIEILTATTDIEGETLPWLMGGASPPYRYRESVAVMKDLWPGDTARCDKRNHSKNGGEYNFNPFVRWLGVQLQRLDFDNLKTTDAACFAAWNALGVLR